MVEAFKALEMSDVNAAVRMFYERILACTDGKAKGYCEKGLAENLFTIFLPYPLLDSVPSQLYLTLYLP